MVLIIVVVSGWFMLKEKIGIFGRGKWLIAAGILPPIMALIIFSLVQKPDNHKKAD